MRTQWFIGNARLATNVLIFVVLLSATRGWAQTLTVFGGPTYDPATSTGYRLGTWTTYEVAINHVAAVNDGGTAVGFPGKTLAGNDQGVRAFRLNATAAVELDHLGTNTAGTTYANAYDINNNGLVIGGVSVYAGDVVKGAVPVRWEAGGTAATVLDTLGTDSSGYAVGSAYGVNDSGTTVGSSWKYEAGTYKGLRAVRWEAGSTAAIELGNLGTDVNGSTNASATAVNSAGTAVGFSRKYNGTTNIGDRAVRWNAGSTSATELGDLGLSLSGTTNAYAWAVNSSGTAVGYAYKYDAGVMKGDVAVRWDSTGTTATELGNLGVNGVNGRTYGRACAINDLGTAVGQVPKYVSGVYKGSRAVRWEAGGTTATELGIMGVSNIGVADSFAYDINAIGIVVGWVEEYEATTLIGRRAVYWGSDNMAIDLNTLIDPSTGWTLEEAWKISDGGWVTGLGSFDPDGAGPQAAYDRQFLVLVPEPSSLVAIGTAMMLLSMRRRR